MINAQYLYHWCPIWLQSKAVALAAVCTALGIPHALDDAAISVRLQQRRDGYSRSHRRIYNLSPPSGPVPHLAQIIHVEQADVGTRQVPPRSISQIRRTRRRIPITSQQAPRSGLLELRSSQIPPVRSWRIQIVCIGRPPGHRVHVLGRRVMRVGDVVLEGGWVGAEVVVCRW
jgi:hypothetical protein